MSKVITSVADIDVNSERHQRFLASLKKHGETREQVVTMVHGYIGHLAATLAGLVPPALEIAIIELSKDADKNPDARVGIETCIAFLNLRLRLEELAKSEDQKAAMAESVASN